MLLFTSPRTSERLPISHPLGVPYGVGSRTAAIPRPTLSSADGTQRQSTRMLAAVSAVLASCSVLRRRGKRHHRVSKCQVSRQTRSVDDESIASFEMLRAVDDRLRLLQEESISHLCSFWSPGLSAFIRSGSSQLSSLSGTCLSILAILEDTRIWKGLVSRQPAEEALISLPKISDQLKTKVDSQVDVPPYGAPILILALLKSGNLNSNDKILHKLLKEVLANRAMRRAGSRQTVSAYVLYWSTKALLELQNAIQIPTDYETDVPLAINRASEVSYSVMCQQLAFYASDDRALFDVVELAYSLLTYYATASQGNRSVKKDYGTAVLNMKLVEKCLNVVFAVQLPDGLWPKGKPIFTWTPAGDDVGNSYVFSFDLLRSLIDEFGTDHSELLERHTSNIDRSIRWAEENVVRHVCSDQLVVRGWRSNHLDGRGGYTGPYAWSTAQVIWCIAKVRRFFRHLVDKTVLHEFDGAVIQEANKAPWQRMLDCDMYIGGKPTTLKTVLESRMLTPVEALEQGRSMDIQPMHSAILFGPPGTAKTTISQSVAYYLGWNFLTIDTGHFLADGLDRVAARMEYIFKRLNCIERTVILFDEIEEFCLDREDKSLSMGSRLLTTAMLTKINDLRRQQQCIFFVATNRLRSFDAAVTRPGRFDALLFVGTPNLEARLDQLRRMLTAQGLARPEEGYLAETIFKEEWDSHLRFINYRENEVLMAQVAHAMRFGDASREVLHRMIVDAAAMATINGPVREEYLIMEGSSRA
eukprot:TRINITY_DN17088_c0_g1_i1.p1 TRINITY_DN17088_c0_g1~~TRINITY_DN17088_c0_g1_i1.p1  ORF type:complete len:773 (-),score=58.24 TRINITY_DN17088_c0_g1_i1:148-2415(-)